MPINPANSTIVNAAVPIVMRDQAYSILKSNGMTMSAYIRHCVSRLIATNSIQFPLDDFKPLISYLQKEIEAGGPEAEARMKRLAEISAMPASKNN